MYSTRFFSQKSHYKTGPSNSKSSFRLSGMATLIVPPPSIAREIYLEDQIQPAVFAFNRCPGDGVSRLCEAFSLPETPRNIAHIMHIVPGLIGTKIGEFLSKRKNEEILYCYFSEVDMHLPFLEALRTAFLTTMHLPAEGEQIDRILQAISKIYVQQNPDCGLDSDQAYILAYATTLLNSDLHNSKVVRKMTVTNFIDNIRNALPDQSVTDKFLESIYQDIKSTPFTFRYQAEESLALAAPRLKGFMQKKNDSWKSIYTRYYFVLANSSLYYYKDDSPTSLSKPAGCIQLVSVSITPEKTKEIVIKANSDEIQNVKFKANGPQIVHDQQKIFLKVSSEVSRDKWLYILKTSSVFNDFADELQPPNNYVSSSAFDYEVSEVQSFNRSDFIVADSDT
ncbi:Sec7 domain containing protein [Tritrichomonas foetus]|uniref:Sec7 domain containing protein n=1 Tax=Tritrichomonas foetus TaxID=1144522 RepID=A0A1J4K712_9EUKA|nr:Sec7 domain containing protein [Tritrichomonas foetus]|eukprot:OHT06688.1 Sec7 domain containing protein [Tritrichomonas foetus]